MLFGFFTDLAPYYLVRHLSVSGYAAQWGLCLSSCVVILAGEVVMTAISRVFTIDFSKVKTDFNPSQVLVGLALSFCLLVRLVGIREGTIAAALSIGLLILPRCSFSLPLCS